MRKLIEWFSRKKMTFSEGKKYCLHCSECRGMCLRNIELLFLLDAIKSIRIQALRNINSLSEEAIQEGILPIFYSEVIKDSDKLLSKITPEIKKRKLNKSYLEVKINGASE